MPRGCGLKRPYKISIWSKGGKTPYGAKGPYMGQKAHGRLAPLCPNLGGNNNVITSNIFD